MKTTNFVFCALLALGLSVNTEGKHSEIAFGSIVDYPAIKNTYSFMARIILDRFRCGGALISDRFIATAKHCLEKCHCFNNPVNDWTGCTDCYVKLRENNDQHVDVETAHTIQRIHVPHNTKNDFALLELVSDANTCTEEEKSKNLCWPVSPVRLPEHSFDIPDLETVRTLGWGATEDSVFSDTEQSEFLRQLDVTINSTSNSLLIMTNVGSNKADPCVGDSGGPLMFRGPDYKWTLVATLRGGGYDCLTDNVTDSISDWNKLSVHVPWIKSIIGKLPGTLPAGTEKTGTPFSGTELPIPIQPNSNASLCSDPSIDTIFQTAAGTSYVFRGESYWKLTSVSIASGYPRRIADDWKGLPNDIDAAFTWQLTDSTYFFSGVNYWKFKNWTADPKNPKSMAEGFPGIPNDVDTAFVWGGNNKMYFFKGNSYWMFDPERKPHVRSDLYPRNISEWDLPRDIEGAMQWSNGKTYFFKEGLYWRFNDVKFSVDLANPKFPRQTTQWWFGCQTTNLKYQSRKDVADEEVDVSN